MEWRNCVLTKISADNLLYQCCHKFNLEPFISISGVWPKQAWYKWSAGFSWEQRHLNECVHMNVCTFLFKQLWCSRMSFEQRHLPLSSSTYMKVWTSVNFKRFLIHISKKQWMRWMSVRLTLFTEKFRGFLDFHKTIFGMYSCMNVIKIKGETQPYTTFYFFKIIFCQYRKNWLGPAYDRTLASSQITKSPLSNKYQITVQKMKFSIEDFFSKCDQIRSFLRIWSNLLRKSLIELHFLCSENH